MARKPDHPRRDRSDQRSDETPDIAGIRVIGGSLRGRKLAYSGDVRTRPMKDRVREAVFNLVGPEIAGTLAIDLFAGTGALGIEALSRGAAHAVFLEKHFPTADLIRGNLKALDIENRGEVLAGDTFVQLRLMRRDGRTFRAPADATSPAAMPWTIFCSPPYEFYASHEAAMLKLLDDLMALAPQRSAFVVEFDRQFDPAKLPGAEQWDVREYDPAIVAIRRL